MLSVLSLEKPGCEDRGTLLALTLLSPPRGHPQRSTHKKANELGPKRHKGLRGLRSQEGLRAEAGGQCASQERIPLKERRRSQDVLRALEGRSTYEKDTLLAPQLCLETRTSSSKRVLGRGALRGGQQR